MNEIASLMPPAEAATTRRRALTDPGVPRPGADIEQAVLMRRSIRAFLPKPVPEKLIRRLLEVARWAPSGSNIQPWRVHVLTGDSLKRYTDGLIAAARGGEPRAMEYNYYAPKWREPYLGRRRACGFGLYGAMGIARDDMAGRTRAHERNYQFFGAPAGMLFWIPSDLEHGSWLDYGMFIHTIILAAYGCGLAATAQGALGECPHVAHRMFDVGNDWKLIGGLSLGWPDADAPVNLFQPDRIEVDEFTTWMD